MPNSTQSAPTEARKFPSIDKLLQNPTLVELAQIYGREVIVDVARETLDFQRREILAGQIYPGDDVLVERISARLQAVVSPTLQPVINATGVVIHTNLGRSPLSDDVLQAMRMAGAGYSNLEYDLVLGERGSRYVHAEALLCRLTGAEAALLVNNNAGAVLLALSALAANREVVISRGQLVEIGGGFRIPDVMAQSGARLVEVGTTNRTYSRDYAEAITGQTAALLRVHSSNFRIMGFVHQPSLLELAELAHDHGLVLMDDLGSGTLLDTAPFGLPHEPMVQESIAAGADLVTFSGDKLLGGPQAGIIVGRADLVARLRKHPLTRALRVDKTTLAGIQANLLHYVKGEALAKIPIWRMMALTVEEIATKAQAIIDDLDPKQAHCQLIEGRSMIGGGSLPEESLPTVLIAISAEHPTQLATMLRTGTPAIVARIEGDRLVLDLRTVLSHEEPALIARLRELL